MALIEMSKPFIKIEKIQKIANTNRLEMTFTLNGCINVTEVTIWVNTDNYEIAEEGHEGYCNWLVPQGKE